jgi:ferritin-like metal-binding protein YciE
MDRPAEFDFVRKKDDAKIFAFGTCDNCRDNHCCRNGATRVRTPRGKNCPAITGIIDEGEEIIDEYEDSPALDAGLIGAAQAVEHYEIARYGTLKAWAKELGLEEAVSLLDATLAEEESTDEKLSNLAESAINRRAEAAE